MKQQSPKVRVALMSYTMDNRSAMGTALYARKLIEELTASETNEFEYTLVHYEKVNDPLYSNAREIIMPNIRLPYGSRFASQFAFFLSTKEEFDIIHWLQPRLYPFYGIAPARKRVVTVHGAGQITLKTGFFDLSKEIFNIVLARFNKRVDAFLAVSDFARDEVITHYHTDPKKTHTTYLGVDSMFRPLGKECARAMVKKYGIETPYILDVSRLQPHKNIPTLIQAYNEFRTTFPEREEQLVLVGRPCPGSEKVFAEARRSLFRHDIRFIDFVASEDLNALYSGAEIFVFPSLLEGFGLPIIEAMAAGVPIITSNTSALAEIGKDSAVLVDPKNPTAIARAMGDLLADASLRDMLRTRGLARAQEFSWSKMADETKEIYRHILK